MSDGDDFLFQSSDDDDDAAESVERSPIVPELLNEFFALRALGMSLAEIAEYNSHCYKQVVCCARPDDVIRDYRPATREHLERPFEMEQASLELRSAPPGSWCVRRSSQMRQIDIANGALRSARARVLHEQKVELYAFSYVTAAGEIRHQRFAFAPDVGWTLYQRTDIDLNEPARVVLVSSSSAKCESFGLFLDRYLATHANAVWERRVNSCW